ncbi:hypothetical protein KSP40_PGU009224 [Platanthera guangdongensis]|uniref:Uncharacterized protein n=1 Tax=Platanthera guangdongensis TaxID=2320717 RepID=A0ABR2MUL1_9ASPA
MASLWISSNDVDSGAGAAELAAGAGEDGVGRWRYIPAGGGRRHLLLLRPPLPCSGAPCRARQPLASLQRHGSPCSCSGQFLGFIWRGVWSALFGANAAARRVTKWPVAAFALTAP